MDIYSLNAKKKICFIIVICMLIIAILLFFASGSIKQQQEKELQLQIISTEYSEPTISTIKKVTYYKPAQFKVTFKNIITDCYYSTNNKDVYEYLETQNNFIYNVKVLQEKENKIIMQIIIDNKKFDFVAIKTIEGE